MSAPASRVAARACPAGVAEVEVGAAGADVGLGVDELVLVVVGAGRAEHVRPVLGQGPAHDRTRDGVRERQHADTVERPFRGTEIPCRGVADALKTDDRLSRQQRSVLVRQPLAAGAHHAHRQACGVRRLLQLECVPLADGCCDLDTVGRHVQEAAPCGGQMGVDPGRHDPAAVGRAVRREQERVVEHQRMRGRFPVQARVPERARIDAVHGLAQIQRQVLRRAAAVPVQRDRRNGVCHDRDADAGAETVRGGHDRILAGERHGSTGLCAAEPDVRQQVVQRRERIKAGDIALRARGHAGVRHDRAPSSGWAAAGAAGAPPRNSRATRTDPAANMPAAHQNAVV